MREAWYCYRRWGASAKVDLLEDTFPGLLARRRADDKAATVTTRVSVTSTTSDSEAALDLGSIMKAAQALSGEIVKERLLDSMIKIAIENAGAQKGFLIIPSEGRLLIEAAALAQVSEKGTKIGAMFLVLRRCFVPDIPNVLVVFGRALPAFGLDMREHLLPLGRLLGRVRFAFESLDPFVEHLDLRSDFIRRLLGWLGGLGECRPRRTEHDRQGCHYDSRLHRISFQKVIDISSRLRPTQVITNYIFPSKLFSINVSK